MTRYGTYFRIILLAGLLPVFAGQAQAALSDYDLGVRQFDRGDWDGAIANFTKAIAATNHLYNAYNNRAYAEAKKGDAAAALADCDRAVQLAPEFAGAYFWRARINGLLTNLDAALADFQTGLKWNPANPPAALARDLSSDFRQRATKRFDAGDLPAARMDLDQAANLCPTNWPVYHLRGYLRLLQGDFSGAQADAEISLAHFDAGQNAFAHEIRAWARGETGDLAGAREACRQALKIYAARQTGAWRSDGARFAYQETDPLLMQGLLAYLDGQPAQALQQWQASLAAQEKVPPPVRAYFEKWIARARSEMTQSEGQMTKE